MFVESGVDEVLLEKIKIKDKWVEALRSGDYKKGDSYLYWEGAHCALGVLAVVADWPLDVIQSETGQEYAHSLKGQDGADVTGYKRFDIFFEGTSLSARDVWNVNDKDDVTFDQVAAWIETAWKV